MLKLVKQFAVQSISRTKYCALIVVGVLAASCAGDSPMTGPAAAASKVIGISFASEPVIASPAGQLNAANLTSGDVLSPSVTHTAGSLIAASGSDTLVITKAELVLSRVELTQTSGLSCDDDDSEHGCTEVERHFVLVNLPTDSTVQTLIDANIPDGTYASLEAKLRVPRVTDDSAATAFLAAHPDLTGANVRVEGTFHGQPFTFLGSVDTRFELGFSPPVTVTGGGVNVTIHTDPTTWFRSASGSLIDPASANAGGINVSTVANNIRRSFRAVRDDERDGHDHGDDDGGHGGDGHGGPGPG